MLELKDKSPYETRRTPNKDGSTTVRLEKPLKNGWTFLSATFNAASQCSVLAGGLSLDSGLSVEYFAEDDFFAISAQMGQTEFASICYEDGGCLKRIITSEGLNREIEITRLGSSWEATSRTRHTVRSTTFPDNGQLRWSEGLQMTISEIVRNDRANDFRLILNSRRGGLRIIGAPLKVSYAVAISALRHPTNWDFVFERYQSWFFISHAALITSEGLVRE